MSQSNEDKLVAYMSGIVAKEYGIKTSLARQICVTAALHDIGKIKIPDRILYKAGKLNEAEFEIMKKHTTWGEKLLISIQGDLGVMARTIARYHHERYDGEGYWGKYTCELPEYVQFVSISDVFVALVSERVYKKAWPQDEAIDYIKNQSGKQFSPSLVETFISIVGKNALQR